MKLSDFVIDFLVKQGIKHVFVLTGGAAAHLIDSSAKHKEIKYICVQHEQAAAMAADGYARVSGNLGAAIATSGPGATNLITGICCSYYDSVPVIFITGQVATFRLKRGLGVRQLGFQESDVINICKPVTKYITLIDDPSMIRYELEKAVYLAKTGRPGPVLIDISDNIQREEVHPQKLKRFIASNMNKGQNKLKKDVQKICSFISQAKRPVIILGAGVRSSDAVWQAKKLCQRLRFPVLLTWAAMDLMPWDHPLVVGGFGINGPRYGNFAVQNSDLIISIGSRLDTHATGSPLSTFAREAKKVIVDIDPHELAKFTKFGMKVDLPVCSDVKIFLKEMVSALAGLKTKDISSWFLRINDWKKIFPVCRKEFYAQKKYVNPYVFLELLFDNSSAGDIFVADTGNNLAQTFQGCKVKGSQRLFSAFNNTPMGYSLPASIGACLAGRGKRIICITGDGGLQMNIQELATVKKHSLAIKIFVFNNRGYGMIKQTQDDWLGSRYVASCEKQGIAVPNFIKIAKAYGIKSFSINNHSSLKGSLKKIMDLSGPVFCNLEIEPGQKNIPMLKYGRPIEDQNPLLNRKEFFKNMIINPLP